MCLFACDTNLLRHEPAASSQQQQVHTGTHRHTQALHMAAIARAALLTRSSSVSMLCANASTSRLTEDCCLIRSSLSLPKALTAPPCASRSPRLMSRTGISGNGQLSFELLPPVPFNEG